MNTQNLGTCPICGKGVIIEGAEKYSCVHTATSATVDNNDICKFVIYKQYFSHELSEEDVKKIIAGETTDFYDDLKRKDGTMFTAAFKLDKENKCVVPAFPEKDDVYLQEKCPICGGDIVVTHNFYGCKNALGENKTCNFFVNKKICGVDIDEKTVEELIKNKTTHFIDSFENKNGDEFCAKLVLEIDSENKRADIKFNNEICKCPKCGGTIRVGKKAYGCSNYKEKGCNFTIWREMHGRKITIEEVKQLCEQGQTDILKGFKTKDKKSYSGKLVLADDFSVKII